MAERVIIIGAGAAGIAAGLYLQTRGWEALLLEARDRVGGRAWTDSTSLGSPIDMGCAWLHSAAQNPWTHYAREHGFEVIEDRPDWRRYIGGRRPTAAEAAAFGAAWSQNESLIEAAAAAGGDVALAAVIPEGPHRAAFDAVMTWYMGANLDAISSVDYARYAGTDDNWAVRQGLGAVVAHAARSLRVQLGCVAETIEWSDQGVTVHTSAGRVEGEAVIVTVPTSVLAAGRPKFEPALPQEWQLAFENVPLGVANKVCFSISDEAIPLSGTSHVVGSDSTARTGNYQLRPAGHAGILAAYYGGRFAIELEAAHALEEFARDELQQIFGSDFVRQLCSAKVSAWHTDAWSRGSYSIALPGHAHRRELLAQPLHERVHFAGEACSLEHFGTVNGAWASGVAVAERLLNDSRRFGSS
jgi:monoamine oxidase